MCPSVADVPPGVFSYVIHLTFMTYIAFGERMGMLKGQGAFYHR